MTLGKATGLALGLTGAVALGIWIGPYVTDRDAAIADRPAAEVTAAPAAGAKQPAARTATARPMVARVPASEPELHKLLKPVLNKGMDMKIAADGFRDAEQFAAVAHASKNTGAPFMVLKHRVLEERKSLAAALLELTPHLDPDIEASRARAEARALVASLEG